jgi:hypothetical protein
MVMIVTICPSHSVNTYIVNTYGVQRISAGRRSLRGR